MLDELVDNMVAVTKTKESQQFKRKSIENLISLMLGKITAGGKLIIDSVNFIYQLPNQIFFNKMKKFLESSYGEIDLQKRVEFADRFSEDEYKKYIIRQIELINSINDERKIHYLANLTRAFILGFVDINVYFKLAYIINQATAEELTYLGENINNTIKNNNAYIFAFQQIGLVKEGLIAGAGQNTSKYFYTEFAISIDKFALKFDEENTIYKYDSSNLLTLESMEFKDTDIDINTMSEEEVEQFKRELLEKSK